MSRINGEKSRAATARRRRNAMRIRTRQLRRDFLEAHPHPSGPGTEAPSAPKNVAAQVVEPAAPAAEVPKRTRRKTTKKPAP